MRRVLGLFVMLGLALAAPLQDVEVKGADTILAALVRISLPFGVGDELGNLDEAKAAVLATGYFKDAKLSIEGNTLIIEVTPNPTITKVSATSKAFPEANILKYLESEQAIGVGSVFNPKKATEAAQALAGIYTSNRFPFEPAITPQTKEVSGGVELTFNIEENPEVKSIELQDPKYIDKSKLDPLVQNISDGGKFSFERYRDAINKVADVYSAAGYRGSGVNLTGTTLQDGILKVGLSELKIADIVTKDVDISSLGIKVGDPFNVEKILDGVNALSRSLSRTIDFTPERISETEIRLSFQAGAQRYGSITSVKLEGNTAFPTEQLLGLLRLKVGDEYNPSLAAEDYQKLLQAYRNGGFDLAGQPDVRFENGVYDIRLNELKIGGYKIDPPLTRTDPSVFLREMPRPGTLFSVNAIRQGISSMLRTGLLAEPPSVIPQVGDKPDELLIVLGIKEGRTGSLQPTIGASNITGAWTLDGNFSISENNLWGLAHQYNLGLGANTNDAGQVVNFSAGYRIPWLYLDYGDLKDVRTGLSFNLYSTPTGNNKFSISQTYNGSIPDLNGDGKIDSSDSSSAWEYTERRNGFGASITRQFSKELPNLNISGGFSYEWVIPFLETGDTARPRCYDSVAGKAVENKACSDALAADAATRLQQQIPEYQSLRFNLGASYTELDSAFFPTQGYTVNINTGYGLTFPNSGGTTSFVPISVTGRRYFRLDDAARQALIVRLAAGTILGTPQLSQRFSLGGNSSDLTTLRGYDPKFLDKGITVVSGSLEYAYDFGLSPTGGTTVYGYLFSDIGRIWPTTSEPDSFYMGAGFGLQVNLDLLGAILPPVRLDYGFSERYPSGRIALRLGLPF